MHVIYALKGKKFLHGLDNIRRRRSGAILPVQQPQYIQSSGIFCISGGGGIGINKPRAPFLGKRIPLTLLVTVTIQLLMAVPGYGQGNEQKRISLDFKNASIPKVFSAIEAKADVVIMYESTGVLNSETVNISARDKTVAEILDKLLKDKAFKWSIRENIIRVEAKGKSSDILLNSVISSNQSVTSLITGHVIDSTGMPLVGATISVLGTGKFTTTNAEGNFTLDVSEDDVLQISFVGHEMKEVKVSSGMMKMGTIDTIKLMTSISSLNQVTVISTGYQQTSRQYTTGSFNRVGPELLHRKPAPDIISRLEGLTGSLLADRRTDGTNPTYSIRGLSTIYANQRPLIVVDNFPYEGDIGNINPNDVESITILKDAAAAAIWGVRAGNGVIVITTRKGAYEQPASISFSSNITIGKKPDLFYIPAMAASDYIEVEKWLFEKGYYRSRETNRTRPGLTPVVELLIRQRDGQATPEQVAAQLDQWGKQDVRRDYEKYFFRTSIYQQYSLAANGGGKAFRYALSGGYDNNLSSLVRNGNNRVTFRSEVALKPTDRLELSAGIFYTMTTADQPNPGYNAATLLASGAGRYVYPYAQLADDNGTPLAVNGRYRESYLGEMEQRGYLDWRYRPLQDMQTGTNSTRTKDNLLNLGMKYRVLEGLDAELKYSYQHTSSTRTKLETTDQYAVRDLINRFTQTDATGNITERPVPVGDILTATNAGITSRTFRGQLNLNRSLGADHHLQALAGTEIRELSTVSQTAGVYGYDSEHGIGKPVNYNTAYIQQPTGTPGMIPDKQATSGLLDRYWSLYLNAAYTFRDRYLLSGSGRIDKSNLFGVKANQRTAPLWSAGLGWIISKEPGYRVAWLPYLKLRATYGYNGNLDKTVSAFAVAIMDNNAYTGASYLYITNPPNPLLRWERSAILNIGIDFGLRDQTLTGSLEYYRKKGTDLIGSATLDPTTGIGLDNGVASFRGNLAAMTGGGVDLELNARILDRVFKWNATLLLSYNTNKITRYEYNDVTNAAMVNNAGGTMINPIVGRPVYSIYSYRWAGLDPQTGDPLALLDGKPSKDYTALYNSKDRDGIRYNGPALPTTFGSLRQTFSYKNVSLSTVISYKLGYYFKRSSISYADLIRQGQGHQDYALRWQQPGDEKHTNVPSIVYPVVSNRDFVYNNADILVEKGDHIRLQDIVLAYELTKSRFFQLPANSLQIAAYVNNVGILWRANKHRLDPDYTSYYNLPQSRSIGLSLKLNF